MLRTSAERWPASAVLVVPIPVQGPVQAAICRTLVEVCQQVERLGIDAIVIGRGGGSREDLAVFDNEELARCLAACPVPVVSGIGHEDDTTVADLVADYRAATPTAALVALLPDRRVALKALQQQGGHLQQLIQLRLQGEHQRLARDRERLAGVHPTALLNCRRQALGHAQQLLRALSPAHQLERGFCLLRNGDGVVVRSIHQLEKGAAVVAQLADGHLSAVVREISPQAPAATP
jgi:exodeoxyribonuclease VII large subunit